MTEEVELAVGAIFMPLLPMKRNGVPSVKAGPLAVSAPLSLPGANLTPLELAICAQMGLQADDFTRTKAAELAAASAASAPPSSDDLAKIAHQLGIDPRVLLRRS